VRRREFITVLGGAAAAWPLVVRAQKTGEIRRIGLLMIIPEGDSQSRADRDALGSGLHELGWITRRNVDLEYRWSDGDELSCVNSPRNWLADRPTYS
jgi:putative tryptophan/tyrosine transport system substrate-binding protein